MTGKKDNILFYALIGVGYLLFCSVIPSFLAILLEDCYGTELNTGYAILSFLTGIVYVIVIFKMKNEKIALGRNWSIKGVLGALGTAIVLFLVINFIVSPFLSVMFPVSAEYYSENVTDMMATPAATFLQVVVIAPLFEELIFRGYIQKRAMRQWHGLAAVLFTAVLFGALHMSIVQGISAAAAGIVLCLFYRKTGSVGLNILAHSIYNGMVYGLALLLRGFGV